MWQSILDALGAARYEQHALCLTSDSVMIFLYVAADFATFLSYAIIGGILFFTKRTPEVVRPSMRVLFGAFISLCALSHLTMVLTLFSGVYRLDIMVRVAMAGVSMVTASVVFRDFVSEKLWRAR